MSRYVCVYYCVLCLCVVACVCLCLCVCVCVVGELFRQVRGQYCALNRVAFLPIFFAFSFVSLVIRIRSLFSQVGWRYVNLCSFIVVLLTISCIVQPLLLALPCLMLSCPVVFCPVLQTFSNTQPCLSPDEQTQSTCSRCMNTCTTSFARTTTITWCFTRKHW